MISYDWKHKHKTFDYNDFLNSDVEGNTCYMWLFLEKKKGNLLMIMRKIVCGKQVKLYVMILMIFQQALLLTFVTTMIFLMKH